ncbi:MAG: M3 family oligoendopeptidase [Bacteroidota bacterium]
MRFKDFEYKQPDFDHVEAAFGLLIEKFSNAKSLEEQSSLLAKMNDYRKSFASMHQIASIRHEMNTVDEEYLKEKDFFDNTLPRYEQLTNQYYQALIKAEFREGLEKEWGKQLFTIAELAQNSFKPEILDDLLRENQLGTEYGKLDAGASIFFEGEERTLPAMIPFMESPDREVRLKASQAYWSHYEKHEADYDGIFNELVKVRDGIAQKLGYANFIEPGYVRMLRSDYGAEDVKVFREQVKKDIVPLASKIKAKQAKRLGLDTLKYHDMRLSFPSGNANPKGDPDWILENGRKMYEDLSDDTGEFINFMLNNELLDVLNRKGKSGGGFCTYINDYRSPFIFANFNGTSGDIDVLTHEAGHAFQVYSSRDADLVEYAWPSLEACEIHSMSMEFLTYPWMEQFFKEDTEKYKYAHLSGSICDIPYLCSVDEFQHWVYGNPSASPKERKAEWIRISKDYMPWVDYSDHPFLERVGIWYKIGHIFQMPFYFIDYALAQICALQFWKKSTEDFSLAMDDYIKLCKAGGSMAFLELVELANLKSPFEPGCIKSVISEVEEFLEKIDDSQF